MLIRFRNPCRRLALPVAALVLIFSVPVPVDAKLVTTESVVDSTNPTDERIQVQQFLARDEVRKELEEMGVDPDEAAARVESLSDTEIQRLAKVIETDPAGEGVGAVIGAVVLVFVILLVTDILGFTKIFPFTRSVR